MVVVRFAPSPTGSLHLGGLRTALYNYLYAKKLGGKWILRIEDTDQTRSVPGSVQGIQTALSRLGLEYDYGPGKPGPHGSYFQSDRLDLYHTHARKLLDSRHAYRCFCTPDILLATRERLARRGSPSTYDKVCLHLTDEEVARRVRAGEKHVVRLNDDCNVAPRMEATTDLIFGPLKDTKRSVATDPILLKTDLFPTYHFASVADDHEMGITHVIRGEEWLASISIHLDIYAALDFTPPKFAHLPLLLNLDGSKMSKRKGDVHVAEYLDQGWEKEGILNWIALAGWGRQSSAQGAPDSATVWGLDDLVANFDFNAITHRRNILDHSRLEYLNKQHLLRKINTVDGMRELATRVQPSLQAAFPESKEYTTVEYISRVITVLHSRLPNIRQIAAQGAYFFHSPEYNTDEAKAMIKNLSLDTEKHDQILTFTHAVLADFPEEEWNSVEQIARLLIQAKGAESTKVFMGVLRHALCAVKDGPSISEIIHTLGRKRVLRRIMAVLEHHSNKYKELP